MPDRRNKLHQRHVGSSEGDLVICPHVLHVSSLNVVQPSPCCFDVAHDGEIWRPQAIVSEVPFIPRHGSRAVWHLARRLELGMCVVHQKIMSEVCDTTHRCCNGTLVPLSKGL